MKTTKKTVFIALFLMTISVGFTQNKVSGVIVHKNNTLTGVKIKIEGSDKMITTDFDGSFSIDTQLTSGKLIFRFLGYKDLILDFAIVPDKNKIDLGRIEIQSGKKGMPQESNTLMATDLNKDKTKRVVTGVQKATREMDKLYAEDFFKD